MSCCPSDITTAAPVGYSVSDTVRSNAPIWPADPLTRKPEHKKALQKPCRGFGGLLQKDCPCPSPSTRPVGPATPPSLSCRPCFQAQVTAAEFAPKKCELAGQHAHALGLTGLSAQLAKFSLFGPEGSSFDPVACQFAIFVLLDCTSALRGGAKGS